MEIQDFSLISEPLIIFFLISHKSMHGVHASWDFNLAFLQWCDGRGWTLAGEAEGRRIRIHNPFERSFDSFVCKIRPDLIGLATVGD